MLLRGAQESLLLNKDKKFQSTFEKYIAVNNKPNKSKVLAYGHKIFQIFDLFNAQLLMILLT